MGDWTNAEDAKMPARYADSRDEAAIMAKLLQVNLVSEAAGVCSMVSWQCVRTYLLDADIEGCRQNRQT